MDYDKRTPLWVAVVHIFYADVMCAQGRRMAANACPCVVECHHVCTFVVSPVANELC